jgi:hypothetical protein
MPASDGWVCGVLRVSGSWGNVVWRSNAQADLKAFYGGTWVTTHITVSRVPSQERWERAGQEEGIGARTAFW